MENAEGLISLETFKSLLSHSHILLTGGTGFVGKVLLEKVLFELASKRTGPAAPETRLGHLLASPIFDRCKAKYSNDAFLEFAQKSITVIPGDLSRITKLNQPFTDILLEPQPAGWTQSVTAIIHCAASLQFEESLVLALQQNTAAALAMHAGACNREMFPSLVSYCHVSTAYVQCDRLGVTKEVLPGLTHLGLNDRDLRALVQKILETGEMPDILGEYPNTYCISKAIAERLLAAQAADLNGPPFVIVRPSIIGCSVQEPVPGWVDSVNAIGGAMLFTSLRVQREIAGIPIVRPDSVPVDRTVNCILLGLVVGTQKRERGSPPVIFHSSFWREDYTWKHIADYTILYCDTHVPSKAINAPPQEFYFNPHKWILATRVLFAYKIPLKVLQILSRVMPDNQGITSGASQLARLVKAIDQTSALFSHFTQNEWLLGTENLQACADRVDPSVLAMFPVINTDIDAKSYILHFAQGVQKFLLKDNPPDPGPLLNASPSTAEISAANQDRVRSAKLMDLLDSFLLLVPSVPYALWSAWGALSGRRKLQPGPAGAGPFAWAIVGLVGLFYKLKWHAKRKQHRLDLGDDPKRVAAFIPFERNLMGLWANPSVLLVWALLTTGQRFLDWRSTAAATLLFRPVWARAAAFHAVLVTLAVWLGAGRSSPPPGTRRTLAIALFVLGLRSRLLGVLTPVSLQFVLGKAGRGHMRRSSSNVF